MRFGRGIVLGGILAAAATIGRMPGGGEQSQRSAAPPAAMPAGTTTTYYVRGAGSCAATACHGGIAPAAERVLRNEHTTWITRDRHANAFLTLCNARSQAIAKNLPGTHLRAHENPRCLACHSGPTETREGGRVESLRRDGVGCESCHGPSDRWIGEHTREDWASRGADVKKEFGMFATRELPDRARACAGCHIGAPAGNGVALRDVDHDLIAAGHPRLTFEFSADLANIPHHWNDQFGPDSDGDFPARSWMIGQLVSAEAALDLLRDRAERARGGEKKDRPGAWPELSEFSCFACHHTLRDEPWRRERPADAAQPGTLPWGSWHESMLETLAGINRGPAGAVVLSEISKLRAFMREPRPDPEKVAHASENASTAVRRLRENLSTRKLDALAIEALLASIANAPQGADDAGWDRATQRYLALVALAESLCKLKPGPDDARRVEDLKRLRTYLSFPTDFDSPKGFSPLMAPGIR